jgi:hypothetical protein
MRNEGTLCVLQFRRVESPAVKRNFMCNIMECVIQ